MKDPNKKVDIDDDKIFGKLRKPLKNEIYPLDKRSIVQPPSTSNRINSENVDELLTSPLDPNAALVSSVSSEGKPNARVILIKDVSQEGFTFYTNYESQKGKELFHNSEGHLTWYSRAQGASIRVQGKVEKINSNLSDEYFSSRDRNAQISASISKQSYDVDSREVLDKEFQEFADAHEGKEIKRPDHWGGIIIMPSRVEVWKSRDDYKTRLHDRIVFTQSNDAWIKTRLYP